MHLIVSFCHLLFSIGCVEHQSHKTLEHFTNILVSHLTLTADTTDDRMYVENKQNVHFNLLLEKL